MENLSDKTKKELADLAKDLKIANYSKLTKPELIELITAKTKKEKKSAPAKAKSQPAKSKKPAVVNVVKPPLKAVQKAEAPKAEKKGTKPVAVIQPKQDTKAKVAPPHKPAAVAENPAAKRKDNYLDSEGYVEKNKTISYAE